MGDNRIGTKRTTPSQHHQIDIIRLLLFTGCRKNEIVCLRRDEVVGSQLRLRDSKTGPRTVFLNTEARSILERRCKGNREYLFPSSKDGSRPIHDDLSLWYWARKEAGLDDVRLHDLRHTYASHAVMQGTPLPVIAKLLGHSQTTMTMRYAHTGDRETEAAAERIGEVISGLLGMPPYVCETNLGAVSRGAAFLTNPHPSPRGPIASLSTSDPGQDQDHPDRAVGGFEQ